MAENRLQNVIIKDWKTKSPPLVSVCCIAYNHVSYIAEAIDSMLMQETDFPFEILLHDDASNDGTSDIVKEYAKRYPEIIKPILQAENQYSKAGLINPRLVFPKALGKYIALCEGDDYWTDKTKLQKQVEFLEANPKYVITYTDCQPFDESGILDIDFGGARRDLESIELKKATPIFTLTACFRNVIREVPLDLMSARYGDQIIWSLLGGHGKGKYMKSILPSAYRIHDKGVSSKKTLSEKHEMQTVTSAALLAYYGRVNDRQLAEYFGSEVLRSSVLSLGCLRSLRTLLILFFRRMSLKFKKFNNL